jgi:hypothetical protein
LAVSKSSFLAVEKNFHIIAFGVVPNLYDVFATIRAKCQADAGAVRDKFVRYPGGHEFTFGQE